MQANGNIRYKSGTTFSKHKHTCYPPWWCTDLVQAAGHLPVNHKKRLQLKDKKKKFLDIWN